MRTCKDCRWFAYQRNPESGRILPSQRGECRYPLREKIMAVARPISWEISVCQPWDSQPFDTTNADQCVTFAPKHEKKPELVAVRIPSPDGELVQRIPVPAQNDQLAERDPDADLHEHM